MIHMAPERTSSEMSAGKWFASGYGSQLLHLKKQAISVGPFAFVLFGCDHVVLFAELDSPSNVRQHVSIYVFNINLMVCTQSNNLNHMRAFNESLL